MTPSKDAFPEPCPPVPTLPEPAGLRPSCALPLSHPHAAGIDSGAAEHWVAVPPERAPQPVRRFGPFPAALDALADWLLDCGLTPGARASTGVSGMPLCARLEARGLQVFLLDPRQATRAPGRPTTARLDCPWRHRLHASGRLAAACRPDDQVGVRRRALRHRQRLLTYGAHQLQPRHQALPQMHRTRSQGVSDLTGAPGMAIVPASLAGARDPLTLAKLRHPPGQHRADEIAKALPGTWRAEHLCAFQHAVAWSQWSPQQRTVCAHHRQPHLGTCAETSAGQPLPPKPRRPTHAHAPPCDARTPRSRLAGVDLTTMEGMAEGTALVLRAESGTDMRRWPSVTHGCSWLGLAPPHTLSGGTVRSRPVRPGAHRVAVALRLAARTVHHARTALGAFSRRRRRRLGALKAITATAHKLARLVSSLCTPGRASVKQGLDDYERPYRARTVQAMARQAQALGDTLVALGTPEGQRLDAVAAPTS